MLFSRYFALVACVLVGGIQTAASQNTKKPSTEKIESQQIKVATFSGSESRINYLFVVQADCTSGPQPEWRVTSKPKHGELRFEPITVPINQKASSPRAHCNGKQADAIGVYYKSNDGFVGEERITIDVNYRLGFISRHAYVVDVR